MMASANTLSKCISETPGSVPYKTFSELVKFNQEYTIVTKVKIDQGITRYVLHKEIGICPCICPDCSQTIYQKGSLLKHYSDSAIEFSSDDLAKWDEGRQIFVELVDMTLDSQNSITPILSKTETLEIGHTDTKQPITLCQTSQGCPKTSEIQQLPIFLMNPDFLDLVEVSVKREKRYALIPKGALDVRKHFETICMDCHKKFAKLKELFQHYIGEEETKKMAPGRKLLKKMRSMHRPSIGSRPSTTSVTSSPTPRTISPVTPKYKKQKIHCEGLTTISVAESIKQEPESPQQNTSKYFAASKPQGSSYSFSSSSQVDLVSAENMEENVSQQMPQEKGCLKHKIDLDEHEIAEVEEQEEVGNKSS